MKTQAPVLPSVNCHIDNPTFTVGELRTLTCDLPVGVSASAQSKMEFSFVPPVSAATPAPSNANDVYQIQFLGLPHIQGTTLVQSVTSYKVGTHNLTQIKLKIDGHEYLVSPQNIETKSIISGAPGSSPTPFPLVGPESVPIPLWWWSTVGILLALIIGGVVWHILKVQKRRKLAAAVANIPKLSPQEIFHAKIRKLESKGLHNKGEYKLFALELTTIIKKTMGEELSFPAEDLTSEELLATLERRHRAYSNTAGSTLSLFLSDLDQIKFAKIETDAQKCSDLLDRGARIGNALFGRIG